jgi:hypothetical protein
VMSPRHFVNVRRTLGGPSPDETARALDGSRRALAHDHASWQSRRDALAAAAAVLEARVRQL